MIALLLALSGSVISKVQTAHAQECEGWFAIGDPSARIRPGLVYDSTRNTVVMFGGSLALTGSKATSETWEYDGDTWRFRSLEGPPRTLRPAMAFDQTRNLTIVFGGFSWSTNPETPEVATESDQMWAWNGQAWTQIPRTGTWPSARQSAALAFDPLRQKLVLFGGIRGASQLQDLWEWDGTQWQEIVGNTPTISGAANFAWDPSRQALIALGAPGSLGTWAWNGTAWTRIVQSAVGGGAGRAPLLAFSDERGSVIALSQNSPAATAFELVGSTWVPLNTAGLPPHTFGQLTRDPRTSDVLLNCFPTSTSAPSTLRLTRDASGSNVWQPVAQRPSPGLREMHAMTHVNPLQAMVLAGGSTPSSGVGSWVLRGNSWSQLSATQPVHAVSRSCAMEWDNARQQLVFMPGGRANIWTPQSQTWTQGGPESELGAGVGYRSVFDTERNSILMFRESMSPTAWTGTGWSLITTSGVAASLNNTSATFDTITNRTIVAGGTSGTATLALDDTTWSLVGSSSPVGSYELMLAFDPQAQGTYAFGGFVGRTPLLTNSTSFPETTWFLPSGQTTWQATSLRGPTGRKNTAHSYDPIGQRIVMHGGFSAGAALDETWVLARGPARIAVHPVSSNFAVGSPLSLFTISRGGGPQTFVWRRNGVALTRESGVLGWDTDTITIPYATLADAGEYSVTVSNACGMETSNIATVTVSVVCDSIDFNNNESFPEDQDLIDLLSVFAGGPCSTNNCNDLDFNNDGLFPSDEDLIAYLRVLAGGSCE
jgi:hypothetical protein